MLTSKFISYQTYLRNFVLRNVLLELLYIKVCILWRPVTVSQKAIMTVSSQGETKMKVLTWWTVKRMCSGVSDPPGRICWYWGMYLVLSQLRPTGTSLNEGEPKSKQIYWVGVTSLVNLYHLISNWLILVTLSHGLPFKTAKLEPAKEFERLIHSQPPKCERDRIRVSEPWVWTSSCILFLLRS